jgi:hypothetical protein
MQRIAKDEPSSLEIAENISSHGESAAFHPGEEQGRSLSLVNPPLYSGDLEVRVNLLDYADKFSPRLKLF